MWVLGALLVFTGLLMAGLSPAAAVRSRRGRLFSRTVAGLSVVQVDDAPRDDSLVAVRGTVSSAEPLSDPITEEDVVWYEVELDVPGASVDVRCAEQRFSLDSDGDGNRDGASLTVDPAGAREVAVRVDVFEPGDAREQVAAYLKRHAVIHRADISVTHRRIAVGDALLVIGRCDPSGAFVAGEAGELILTTHSLEAVQERELASAKSSMAGAVLLAALGLGCAAIGAVVLVF